MCGPLLSLIYQTHIYTHDQHSLVLKLVLKCGIWKFYFQLWIVLTKQFIHERRKKKPCLHEFNLHDKNERKLIKKNSTLNNRYNPRLFISPSDTNEVWYKAL